MSLIRMPDLSGLASIFTGSLRGRLDAIRAAILRGEDGHRSTRSMLELMLHELQHPKQVLYEGPDTAINDQGVYVSPWIDTNLWRIVGCYIANTAGVNPLASTTTRWSEDPAGAAPFIVAAGAAAVVPVNTCWFSQDFVFVAGGWRNTSFSPLAARYVRYLCYTGAGLATTVRCKIVGMR